MIWNGFDSGASLVQVNLDMDRLGGVESVRILDNGSGIDHGEIQTLFGGLGESWKKDKRRAFDRALHGKNGKGRFKAFALGTSVAWRTTYANTSHAAQGKTVDRGILIMGERAIQVGELRQGYVSNSRFEHSQAIYTTDLKAAKEAMGTEKERKLALDLVSRRKEVWKETMKRIQVNKRFISESGRLSARQSRLREVKSSTGHLYGRNKNGTQGLAY